MPVDLEKSLRVELVEELMRLIRADLDVSIRWPENVTVQDFDPGGDATSEDIFVVDVDGSQEITFGQGPTEAPRTSDAITVTLIARAEMSDMTAPQARDRIDEFYRAIRRVAYHPDYRCLGGNPAVESTSLGRVTGPFADPAGDAGYLGFLRADFEIITDESEA